MTRRGRLRAWVVALPAALLAVAACGWDPTHPFDRDSPQVKTAVRELGDSGDATVAGDLLEAYLGTGGMARK